MNRVGGFGGGTAPIRRSRARWAVPALLLAMLAGLVAVGVDAVASRASVGADPAALARIGMPFGGGTIQSISVTGGREQRLVSTELRGDKVWPTGQVPVGERVTVVAKVARPGWISWLTGATEVVRVSFTTPSARLRSHYLTVRRAGAVKLRFQTPVRMVAFGTSHAALQRHLLSQASTTFSIPISAAAGSFLVAAAPRPWETAHASLVSYFPAGATATAVATPAPGSPITPTTPISLTFSKPVLKVLGHDLPPVTPAGAGAWQRTSSHTITFAPQGYGYGLGASVRIELPSGVRLVGGEVHGTDPSGNWSVPRGTTLRLQQLLATLGYLPVSFEPSGPVVGPALADQVRAAIHPPAGSFHWRYANVPGALRTDWSPGAAGVVTRGAVMAFENDHGITPDGDPGPIVWKALLAAAVRGERSSFGYTFVMVSKGSPESINVWHDGRTVVSGPVNTGVAAAQTASGIYPVFEHLPSTTMSGTNPDGSHYSDPGIPWVSYFNGGDALHGFHRASYGFPQSDGCVEMPYGQAARVYPYTPIGTLVDVS